MQTENILLLLIILAPIAGFLINGFFGKKLGDKGVSAIAISGIAIPFLSVLSLFIKSLSHGYVHGAEAIKVKFFEWLPIAGSGISVAYQVDQLSLVFGLFITGISLLIHIYSTGYMHGDRSYYRFFAYMNLFVFMMLNLVFSDNLLLTFLGWEGVGLSSYLLIGFWYDKKFSGVGIKSTSDAANKAFIVNRIGDFGFLVAIFFLFSTFNSFEYTVINEKIAMHPAIYQNSGLFTIIGLMIFLACTGKSAQLPLAVWLPDAMAGPTSVSALIHAATMVTSGIYLIARNSVIFALSPVASEVVLVVGIITALFAAIAALSQNDIKKVLAYSTVSQLGFMFAALGVGAYGVAVFHVLTHAFFKALLFLGSGSVIHAMHEQQDIKMMGGLKKYMPTTYKTFLVGTLAISGIPFFSGFFSKDEIMWYVFSNHGFTAYFFLALAAFMTAFYMFRLLYLTFHGEERFDSKHIHPHESPKSMTIPLIILAFLAAFGGFIGIPHALGGWFSEHPNLFENYLHPIFVKANEILGHGYHHVEPIEYGLMLLAIAIVGTAWYWAYKKYANYNLVASEEKAIQKNIFYKLSYNKFYIDEIYLYLIVKPLQRFSETVIWKFVDKTIIDGILHTSGRIAQETGKILRRVQTGYVPHYLMFMTIGIVIVLFVVLMKVM